MNIHYETIECHGCETVQTVQVENSTPPSAWCVICGKLLEDSKWTRVSYLKRDYAVRALGSLKTQRIKSKLFIENGINISDFEIDYSALIEESIAIILATDESLPERILDDLNQWLDEDMSEVHDEENIIIVHTASQMIDYILKYTNANITTK